MNRPASAKRDCLPSRFNPPSRVAPFRKQLDATARGGDDDDESEDDDSDDVESGDEEGVGGGDGFSVGGGDAIARRGEERRSGAEGLLWKIEREEVRAPRTWHAHGRAIMRVNQGMGVERGRGFSRSPPGWMLYPNPNPNSEPRSPGCMRTDESRDALIGTGAADERRLRHGVHAARHGQAAAGLVASAD